MQKLIMNDENQMKNVDVHTVDVNVLSNKIINLKEIVIRNLQDKNE